MLLRSQSCTRGVSNKDPKKSSLYCSGKHAGGEIIAGHGERIPRTPESAIAGTLPRSGSPEYRWQKTSRPRSALPTRFGKRLRSLRPEPKIRNKADCECG